MTPLVTGTTPRWRQVAQAVILRRRQLGFTQDDVRKRGGPSTELMRNIEGAQQTSYRGVNLARLEAALNWEFGSIQAILDGGAATEKPGASTLGPQPEGLTIDDVMALIQRVTKTKIDEIFAERLSDSQTEAYVSLVVDLTARLHREVAAAAAAPRQAHGKSGTG